MAVEAPANVRVSCVTGNVGTGKTEYLIKVLTHLLKKGVEPRDIAVYCASPNAAAAFKDRLNIHTSSAGQDILITTPWEEARSILDYPEARELMQRTPHLMTQFEKDFLFEDLKVSGILPKRLREILKFFKKGWTELQLESDEWLITNEEIEVHGYLMNLLTSYGSMFDEEVSSYAVRFLRHSEEARQKEAHRFVFVDDYQNLSHASQVLTHLLSSEDLIIAGNSQECVEVFESYPSPEGFEEELLRCPSSQLFELKESMLAPEIANSAQNILKEDATEHCLSPRRSVDVADITEGAFQLRSFGAPSLEFAGIADLVAGILTLTSQHTQDKIMIACSHPQWQKQLSQLFKELDIETSRFPSTRSLSGNVHALEASGSLRVYTLLKLAANRKDSLSWRCWCGFGDYLAKSDEFSALKSADSQQDLYGLLEAACLQQASTQGSDAENPAAGILARFAEGKGILNKVEGVRGPALLQEIARLAGEKDIPPAILELSGTLGEEANAQEIISRIQENLFTPQFSFGTTRVFLGPFESTCGMNPAVLIVCGFMNGFVPKSEVFDGTVTTLDKQKKLIATDIKRIYSLVGKANQQLVLTYSKKVSLETAERLKLKTERIRLEEGERVSALSPSVFLDCMLGSE